MKMIKTEWANGILMLMLIGIYFLIIEALGLTDNFYLRLVNIVLVATPVNLAIMQRAQSQESTYLSLFKSGVYTSIIGIGLSVVALGFYMGMIMSPREIKEVSNSILVGTGGASIFQICLSIGIEAMVSAFLITFILLQYWKNYSPVRDNT